MGVWFVIANMSATRRGVANLVLLQLKFRSMDESISVSGDEQQSVAKLPWYSNLSIGTQLLLSVNGICFLLIVAFLSIDYGREVRRLIETRHQELHHEAYLIANAVRRIDQVNNPELQSYINDVCVHAHKLNAPGHVILVQVKDRLLHSYPLKELPEGYLEKVKQTDLHQDRNHSSVKQNIVVGKVIDGDLKVYVIEDADDLHEFAAGQAISQLWHATLIAITAAIILNTLLVRLFIQPVHRTIEAVEQIGNNEFGKHVVATTNRELRDLTEAVNAMSDSLAEARNRRRAQMNKASSIQQGLLPKSPKIPGAEIAVIYDPAEMVAGDFYDVVRLPDGSCVVCMVDVAGHGIPAALAAAMLKSLIAVAAEQLTSLAELVEFVNRHFSQVIESGMFATAAFLRFPQNAHTVEYINAGHPPVLFIGAKEIKEIEIPGFPLGISCDLVWESETIPFNPQDRLLLYTDGVVESFDQQGGQFGVKRLISCISRHRQQSPQKVLQQLRETILAYRAGQAAKDDLTALLIEKK